MSGTFHHADSTAPTFSCIIACRSISVDAVELMTNILRISTFDPTNAAALVSEGGLVVVAHILLPRKLMDVV